MDYVKAAQTEKPYQMYSRFDEKTFQLVFSHDKTNPFTIELFANMPFAEFRKTQQWKDFHKQMTMWLNDYS